MKKIKLTRGKYTSVSNKDYKYLNQHKWYAMDKNGRGDYYAVRWVKSQNGKGRRTQFMHKVILGIDDTKIMGDHKDQNSLNNLRSNLREATHTENMCNRGKAINNKSGYKGVTFNSRDFKYQVRISAGGKNFHFGYFTDPIQGAKMYDFWARDLHGEFAYTNFKGKIIRG